MRTEEADYAARLGKLESIWWKRWLDVQRPYRRHLRGLSLGFVLDIGCGLGRNLINLGGRGAGIGVDHSAAAVEAARARGLEVFLPDAFQSSGYAQAGRFDALLFSHILEHLRSDEAQSLLSRYRPYVRSGGRVVLITPQEAGFRSDSTHVQLMDLDALGRISRACGLEVDKAYSFPFPRIVGRVFKYNEFVVLARAP
jgi:SAM-dependent methyltransferase